MYLGLRAMSYQSLEKEESDKEWELPTIEEWCTVSYIYVVSAHVVLYTGVTPPPY